jgi:hypothetical protein
VVHSGAAVLGRGRGPSSRTRPPDVGSGDLVTTRSGSWTRASWSRGESWGSKGRPPRFDEAFIELIEADTTIRRPFLPNPAQDLQLHATKVGNELVKYLGRAAS